MSFKSRQKKRAISAGKRAATASEHYLTLVGRKCACNACGGILDVGSECVYRHTPREILCPRCGEARAEAAALAAVGTRASDADGPRFNMTRRPPDEQMSLFQPAEAGWQNSRTDVVGHRPSLGE
jgi:hypothetical protein